MCSVIKNSQSMVLKNETMKTILERHPVISSKRQAPSLRKLLTNSQFTSKEAGVNKCGDKRRAICPALILGTTYKLLSGKTLHVKRPMSCSAEYCLYCLICTGCKKEYIGYTTDLRSRMTVHRQQTRNGGIPCDVHFGKCAKNNAIKFRIFPFFRLQTEDLIYLKEMEIHFIQDLSPPLNIKSICLQTN